MEAATQVNTSVRARLGIAAAATAGVVGLGIAASIRDGAWSQAPLTDCAVFHGDALEMLHALRSDGVKGFAGAWVHVNETHAPLVPALSALVMAVFGTSRHVAEAVLPLFTFVFVYSLLGILERLYDRRTALWGTAVFVAFPVFLNLSRIYLYELPFSALIVAACAAMVSSQGFRELRPTLTFGALVGLASLARAAGGVLITGPAIVYLIATWRAPARGLRLRNLTLAASVAALLASSWYAFNWRALVSYIESATYGEAAHIFAGGSSLSLDNALIYLHAFVLEGPGLPLCAVAAIALAAGLRQGGIAFVKSPTMAALLSAFAVDFLVLMLAAQRCGSILFVSVLPIFAVAIVRPVLAIGGGFGWALRGIVIALTLVSAVGAAFTFPPVPGTVGGSGPFAPALPLWSHRSIYLTSITYPFEPFADYRAAAVIERLEREGLPPDTPITVLTDHPYVSAHGYRYEALRKDHRWRWIQAPPIALRASQGDERWLESVRQLAAAGDWVLLRKAPQKEPPSRQYTRAMEPLLTGEAPRFIEAGEALLLGDGSSLHAFRKRP